MSPIFHRNLDELMSCLTCHSYKDRRKRLGQFGPLLDLFARPRLYDNARFESYAFCPSSADEVNDKAASEKRYTIEFLFLLILFPQQNYISVTQCKHLYLYRSVCVYPSDGIHVVACGPIRTKFCTHMQIHLHMVVS